MLLWGIVALAVMVGLMPTMTAAANASEPLATISLSEPDRSSVSGSDRERVLGNGWKNSRDIAWTTTSDAQGFHILTASESDGYAWRTTASLSEPGFDADAWIGNVCVTGSGKRAVVVYAPRTFTNDPRLMARGGFSAIVDLVSGSVKKLDITSSLSYYNPGCGVGESAILTQSAAEDMNKTRLIPVNVDKGKVGEPVVTEGQVTSAIQSKDGIVAAFGSQLVSISAQGTKKVLLTTTGTPYRITPDGDGGLVFMDRQARADIRAEATTHIKRLSNAGKPALIAEGKLSAVGLTQSAGTVYLTGDITPIQDLPRGVVQLVGSGKDAVVSTSGRAVVQATAWADGVSSPQHLQPAQATDSRPVNIKTTIQATGKAVDFTVRPLQAKSKNWDEGRIVSPRLGKRELAVPKIATGPTAVGSQFLSVSASSPTEIVESERTCSVPRNDPRNQAMQPKPRQVEWAVDQAVTGFLNTHVSRPANWKNLDMPAYMPQSLFLNPPLTGGGRVPAQILLGITAQESNMWQAARTVVPGVTGNPLIGNYYGIDYYDGNSTNDWDVNFAKADCGYGITQVTDHMRLAGREDGHGGPAWDYQKQRAVALDYTANVSAGLQILVDKWNTTKQAGLVIHDSDPRRLENWFFALWAYNSGFYPNNASGPWGVGWANNPANPEWDAGRTPFMEDRLGNEDASAAARPQHWPYPEKVLGFAAHPPAYLESPGKMVAAYRGAWWNGTPGGDATVFGSDKYYRARVKPPEDLFCGPANECNPSKISDGASNSSPATGPCQRADSKCWWSQPVSWKSDCSYSCGNEFMRFNSTYPEEADGNAYTPNCTATGLPPGSRIIDDLPTGTPVVRPNCDNTAWSNQGSFGFTFSKSQTESAYPSKVDLHQLGAGFGGHFYFGHSLNGDAKGERLKITGTWKASTAGQGQYEVLVHLPDHGAQAKSVTYEILTRWGPRFRTIDQKGSGNRWKSLGYFDLADQIEVKLTTVVSGATGDLDVAFDAIAFAPSNHSYIPTVNIPEPSSTPSPPNFGNQVPENFNLPPTLLSEPSTERKCGPKDPSGMFLCVKSQPNTGHFDSEAGQRPAASAWKPIVPRCATLIESFSRTRFDACMKQDMEAQVWIDLGPGNGGLSYYGSAFFHVLQEIKFPMREAEGGTGFSNAWASQSTLQLFKMTGSVTTMTVTSLKTSCSIVACSAVAPPDLEFREGATWTSPVDNHMVSSYTVMNWTNGATGTFNNFWLNTDVWFSIPNGTTLKGGGWSTLALGDFRCDTRLTSSPACVVSSYKPTWELDDDAYPVAAAYYWLLREKLPSHPGSKKEKSPLRREADSVVTNENTQRMCKRGITAELQPFSLHLDAMGDSLGSDCDEFPFKSTKQSGGRTHINGKPCVQLFAAKEANKWRLFADGRYDPPTWSEVCGRAAIPSMQNQAAGRDLGGFYLANRMLDDDAFYFISPRYEGCNTNTVCSPS